VPRRRGNNGRILVFKGRKAKLNQAIFQTLSLKGPKTIYGIHKIVKTRKKLKHVRYATLNKRVRSLEKSGYIKKYGVKKTKAGFQATVYELTGRAYLAMILNSISLNELIIKADDTTTTQILSDIILAKLGVKI
jgi:DNA-binding PadR family transcriptional regulator